MTTRTKALAASLAAGGAALALFAAVSSTQAQGADDPLLSARMRELKRLRAELARLQAEIPRASNARKLAIERELLTLDAKLERLLKTPSPIEDAPISGWIPQIGTYIEAQAGRRYAAVVQLGWFLSLFADGARIERELREAMPWSALQVSGAPIEWAGVPWTTERSSGRYWVLGTPTASTQAIARPSQLLELFVAA